MVPLSDSFPTTKITLGVIPPEKTPMYASYPKSYF